MPVTLQQLWVAIYVIGGISQLVQLGIQLAAFRLRRYYGIGFLCVSTAAGLLYLLAGYGMNALGVQSRWLPRLFWVLIFAFAVQIILGIWGTAAVLLSRRSPIAR